MTIRPLGGSPGNRAAGGSPRNRGGLQGHRRPAHRHTGSRPAAAHRHQGGPDAWRLTHRSGSASDFSSVLLLELGGLPVDLSGAVVCGDLRAARLRRLLGGRFGRCPLGLSLQLEGALFALLSANRALAFSSALPVCLSLIHLGVKLPGGRSANLSFGQIGIAMVHSARVRLLEVDPDLGSLLTADELAEARQLAVPVVTIERGDENLAAFGQQAGFGALVLEGMVLHQIRVADQVGMRLLGPSDLIPLTDIPPPMSVAEASLRGLPETRLAVLGREVLFATRRWPGLASALQLRTAQQADRLAVQLVICQLPRVDQRLLTMLWLLAESWGRVTPSGTALPLKLTHEALGALIGARRPTVTLALRELTERGAVVRQAEGWLLLESPPESSGKVEDMRAPALVEDDGADWAAAPSRRTIDLEEAKAISQSYEMLKRAVADLREQHTRNRDEFTQRLSELSSTRKLCEENRRRIARDRLSRSPRRAPSS